MTSFDNPAAPALGPRLAGLVDALFGFDAHVATEPHVGSGGADPGEAPAFSDASKENR